MGIFKPNMEKLKKNKDVKGLIKALQYWDLKVKLEGIRALGEIGDEKSVKPLINLFKECDKSGLIRIMFEIETTLTKIGRRGDVESLIDALKEDRLFYRVKIAEVLRDVGETAVVPLIRALKNGDLRVRERAAWILGEIGDERAVEPLIKSLEDDDWHIRGSAADALGKIGDRRAIKPLERLLYDEYEVIKRSAKEALEKIRMKKLENNMRSTAYNTV